MSLVYAFCDGNCFGGILLAAHLAGELALLGNRYVSGIAHARLQFGRGRKRRCCYCCIRMATAVAAVLSHVAAVCCYCSSDIGTRIIAAAVAAT